MEFLTVYIIKLSVSLTVVFLFYWCLLRRLTFYILNRWYLLGYTVLCFFIPLINITPVAESSGLLQQGLVQWVPVLHSSGNTATDARAVDGHVFDGKIIVTIILAAGMLFMLARAVIQLLSFKKLLQKAVPLQHDGLHIYTINSNIIPFSFGNAVFINPGLHTAAELQEIIQHELVHAKQRHSIDIIWAELLCVLNWYNPFVWLIKKCIRQNLEFIADNTVLQNGIDKKAYQYLLLKVAGNNQYSLANQFNFSSLKKRIAMMNKTKSTKTQLLRLLFLLPATAVLLLAFRSARSGAANTVTVVTAEKKVSVAGLVVDSRTLAPLEGATIFCKEKNITVTTDARGYYLLQLPFENEELRFTMLVTKEGYEPWLQTEHWGNFYLEGIYKAYSKSIEYFGLGKKKDEGFSSLHTAKGAEGLVYQQVAERLKKIFDSNSPDFDGTIKRPKAATTPAPAAAATPTAVTAAAGSSLSTDAVSAGGGSSIATDAVNITATGISSGSGLTTAGQTNVATVAPVNGLSSTGGPVNIALDKADITLGDLKRLVILDGKELPAGIKTLNGSFKLNTLSSEEGKKKYGDKGKNGVVEITTQ